MRECRNSSVLNSDHRNLPIVSHPVPLHQEYSAHSYPAVQVRVPVDQHAPASCQSLQDELQSLLQGGRGGSGEGQAEVADAEVPVAVGLQRVGAIHHQFDVVQQKEVFVLSLPSHTSAELPSPM
jgi:hypothetical protein